MENNNSCIISDAKISVTLNIWDEENPTKDTHIMKRRTFNDYSYINKLLLNVSGVLPRKSTNDVTSVYLVFLSLCSLAFLIGPSLYSLIFNWNNIETLERFDIAVTGHFFILCITKVIILFPKREKHYWLMESCSKLWKHVRCEKDLANVEEYAIGKLHVMYIYLGCAFALITLILTAPLFQNFVLDANGTVIISKTLPWPAGRFHDNVMQFNVWYAFQVPTTLQSIATIVAFNTAPLFYVSHAGIHMRLCQKFFASLADNVPFEKTLTRGNADFDERSNRFFRHLVKGIAYHSEILQYTKEVEEIFQDVIFAEIFALVMTTGGYCVLSQVVPKEDLMKIVFGVLVLLLQMILLCWPPDSLQDESFRVSHEVYNLDWYDWTKKEGKLIHIIIEKSQQPLVITANKMTVISLETLGWLLKSAFSMITLLRRVME